MTSVVLPVALAIIMFTIGLGLTVDDFKRVFVMPRGVLIGLANLLLISPLLAFLIAEGLDLAPTMAIGLVLLGASPGGTLANMFTHLARGETALSVTMTAISSVVALITIPFYLGLAYDRFGTADLPEFSMFSIALRTFLITLLPLSLGLWAKTRWPEKLERVKPSLTRVSLVLFVLVVLGAVASEWTMITENIKDVAIACVGLNIVAMTLSFALARLSRLNDRQATAIALELGVHNGTVAIAVAGMLPIDDLMAPAAVYSLFMFLTAGLFARFMHARNVRHITP